MSKLSTSHGQRRLAPSWELLSNAPGLQCVRMLFALVSGHMLLLAAFLVHLQLSVLRSEHTGGNNTTELGAVNAMLSLWILALLYGGGCGVYAAVTCSLVGAVQTLGCWGFATVAHTWYLLFGVQIASRQLYPPKSAVASTNWSLWTIALHVLTDALSTALLVYFVVLLRARERAGGDEAELQPLTTRARSEASSLAQSRRTVTLALLTVTEELDSTIQQFATSSALDSFVPLGFLLRSRILQYAKSNDPPRDAREDPEELDIAKALRFKVFIDEQGFDPAVQIDEQDSEETTIHFLGKDVEQDKYVAVARVLMDADARKANICRVAVLSECRGKNYGVALMTGVEQYVADQVDYFALSAQYDKKGFYERCGYSCINDEIYLDEGVEHCMMMKKAVKVAGN